MSIYHLPDIYFTNAELKILREEDRLLDSKYAVQHIITQDDINSGGKYEGCNVGQIETRNPEDPTTIESALELFFNYYTQSQFIHLKFNFLINHLNENRNWNIADIEDELTRIRDFIQKAQSNEGKGNQFQNDDVLAYRQIKSGFFKTIYFSPSTRSYVSVYARYVLFYDFLREKLKDINQGNKLYKLSPEGQLDEVISVMKENTNIQGLTMTDIHNHLGSRGYVCGYTILTEMLQKMKRDNILTYDDGAYSLNFEARIFTGYENEKDENEKMDRNEIDRTLRLERATWLAGIAASGLLAVEILKNFHWVLSINLLTFLFVFLFGIIGGIIIYKLISDQGS